MLHTDMQKN